MKNKKEKKFDAVKMMRDIRTKIAEETANMSYDELQKFIKERLRKSSLKPIS